MNRLPVLLIMGLLLPLFLKALPERTYAESWRIDRLHSARLAQALLDNNYDDQIAYLLSNPSERFILRASLRPDDSFTFHTRNTSDFTTNRDLFDSSLVYCCIQYITDKVNQLDSIICPVTYGNDGPIKRGQDYFLNTALYGITYSSSWFQSDWQKRDSITDKRSPREFLQHWSDSVINAPIKTRRDPWNYKYGDSY